MDKKEIAHLKFDSAKPTKFNLKLLHDWVIWQFPKKAENGFLGAVHPPFAKHGWIPATINLEKQVAQIYGHLSETFVTPELAADYLGANGNLAK